MHLWVLSLSNLGLVGAELAFMGVELVEILKIWASNLNDLSSTVGELEQSRRLSGGIDQCWKLE